MTKKKLLAIQLNGSQEHPPPFPDKRMYYDGIYYVVSYLLSTKLYDIDVCQMYWGDSPSNYNLYDYDALLISATGRHVAAHREMLTGLRTSFKKPIIFGGPHATFAPYDVLKYADFAVIGSGEITAERLLNQIFFGSYPDAENVPDNVAIISEGALIIGKLSKQKPPMLAINPLLFKKAPKDILGSVNSTRGCVYNCTFCFGKRIHGNVLYKKDVELIKKEIVDIYKQTGWSHFYFTDLNFGCDKQYTLKLMKAIGSKKFTFSILARAELGDDLEFLKELSQLGVSTVQLGLESINQKVLSSFNKKTSAKLLKKRVSAFCKAGIISYSGFIFGVDDQKYDDILQTAKWVAKNKMGIPCFLCYSYYRFQEKLFNHKQTIEDWRIMDFSPAFQNQMYVSIYPRTMRPSRMQEYFIKGYKIYFFHMFLNKAISRLSFFYGKDISKKEKELERQLYAEASLLNGYYKRQIYKKMKKHIKYLKEIEAPYYDSNDRLDEERLKEDYYKKAKMDKNHLENMRIIKKGEDSTGDL